jgi:hypothetical protein
MSSRASIVVVPSSVSPKIKMPRTAAADNGATTAADKLDYRSPTEHPQ